MLRDQYPIDKLFVDILPIVPKMEPHLEKIDQYLVDDRLFQLIRNDLAKRRPKTLETGRKSTPVEVILRMLVVKRLYGFSYEETERFVSDSLVLRQFCRVYLYPVPDDTTLIRTANLILPKTLEQFNERISHLAQAAKITSAKKLRTDGTVVETNIHTPADNWQLADSIRVLARTTQRARQALGIAAQASQETVEQLTTTAKRISRRIGESLRKRSEEAKAVGREAYKELIGITEQTVTQAQQVLHQLQEQPDPTRQHLLDALHIFIPRAEQVISQTRRRVLDQQAVPAADKLVSIFEAHTDIIRRNKVNQPVEYGHKVWLNELDGGIVSHYRVLEGNPSDSLQWIPSLDAHVKSFGSPPQQASADRGLSSQANEEAASTLGIEHVILPKRGYRSKLRQEYEAQEWFVAGRKWHAGVEGRISVLKRAHQLGRCLNHGWNGFQCWVGWGIIAGNLAILGRS